MHRLLALSVLVLGVVALMAGPASAFSYNQPPTDPAVQSRNHYGGYGGYPPCGSMYYIASNGGGVQNLMGFYFDTGTADVCPVAYQVLEFYSTDGSTTLTMFVAPGAHLLIDQQQLKDMGYYGLQFTAGNGGGVTVGDPCTAWDHPATFVVVGDQVLPANCPAG